MRFEFRGSDADEGDVTRFFTLFDALLEDGEPFGVLIEASALSSLSPRDRRSVAKWIRNRHEPMRSTCLAYAYVVANPLGQMIVRSILMLQEPPGVYGLFTTRREAICWLHARLSERGVEVPRLDGLLTA